MSAASAAEFLMAQMDHPRRWWRRVLGAVLALLGLLVVAVVTLVYNLPRLIETGFVRGAAAIGFEQAQIEVPHADLAGLRAENTFLSLGPIQVSLREGSIDYSVPRLLSGQVSAVVIAGLELQLDFTRRDALSEAVATLKNALGEGDEPLVWPVDRLELRDCRLVLGLPGGPQEFLISGTAERLASGQVSFSFESTHPAQELRVNGSIATETMDGFVRAERVSLQPEFLLGLARELQLFDLPADTQVTAERMELTGELTLTAGSVGTFSARLRAPRTDLTFGTVQAAIEELEIEASDTAPDRFNPRSAISAQFSARDQELAWAFEPVRLQLALEEGSISGGFDELAMMWKDAARLRGTARVLAGVPDLGGPARAQLDINVNEAAYGELAFVPFSVRLQGWREHVEVELGSLRLQNESPATLTALAATISDPLGPGRAVEGSARLVADTAATSWLPEGWQLLQPALPVEMARLDFRATFAEGSPAATLVARDAGARFEIAHGESPWTATPELEATLRLDRDAIQANAVVTARELDLPNLPPGASVREASFSLDTGRVSLAALQQLSEGQTTLEDLNLRVTGSLSNAAGNRSELGIALEHPAGANEWTAHTALRLAPITAQLAAVGVEELAGEMTLDVQNLSNPMFAGWADQPPTLKDIIVELLPRTAVKAQFTASAIARPDVARVEWLSFDLEKPFATEGAPALQASLKTNAGMLRFGAEAIEQPSIEWTLVGDADQFAGDLKVGALVEGRTLELTSKQTVALDWEEFAVKGEGTFQLQPFTLRNSDVVARFVPAAKGLAVSATLQTDGTLRFDSTGEWDGTARVQLTDGLATQPTQELRADGIFADVAIDSLAQLRMPPGQRVGFGRVTYGQQFVLTDGLVTFRTDGLRRLYVEDAATSVFGGRVSTGPFSLFFPNPDVAVVVEMRQLDLAELSERFELVQGSITGRVNGRLPVGLLAGQPIFGQGYLELDPEFPARFSYDAQGFFTRGLPEGANPILQFNRLPYELLEEGLGSLDVAAFHVDLFRRDLPNTPVRIVFSGRSRTPRADVPLEITTNINGPVRDILNFLVQMLVF